MDKQRLQAPRTAAALLFAQVFLSLLAGTVGGYLGRIIYMLSFLIPILLFTLFLPKMGFFPAVRPTRVGFLRILPLLPIFLVAVILTATATSATMDLLGMETTGGSAEGAGFFSDLFTDCVFPALLEEGLMRFAVLSLLLLWSDRHAVWVSALLFALLHASLYQLPYAFVGGLLLGLAAVWGGSPLFAVLFHFLSNLLSLFLQYSVIWFGATASTAITLSVMGVLFALAAWGAILLLRRSHTAPKDAAPTDWRVLLLSPLSLWGLLMLILTVL